MKLRIENKEREANAQHGSARGYQKGWLSTMGPKLTGARPAGFRDRGV